ncbi:hypothetical protein cypCar_00026415 [Cyprinus carpio]|nr:hypothetical protein cypCar_00026415 [Cyprinus carpio]
MLLYDGSPCATKGSDGKWYRSVLQQSTVSDVVKVFHVDYGIGDFVKLCNIRPLSPRFFRLPVVTYACALHGVIDKGIGWRTEQIDYLKSVVLDQILVGKFEHHSVNEGVYYITLYGNDNGNVNDTFGQREQCLSLPERICNDQTLDTLNKVAHKYMYERNVPVRSLNSTALAGCSDSLEDVTVARPSKTGKNLQSAEGRRSSNAAAAPPFRNEAYVVSQPKTEVGAKEQVQITCVQSVNQFYGHFAENTDTVRKMTKDIQQLCHKPPQAKFSICPKMMCLAKYADGLWHRGQIESTHPKILVQFVDYGDLVVLDKSDILPLPPKASAIASIPIQAVQFELFNVTLPEPCELNEWFKNYATDYMFSVIVKQNSSGKLSVEMYDEKTNLNSKIKEQWNQMSKRNGSNISKGMEKARTFNKSSEGMESSAVRDYFSTTSQSHEKTSKKVPKPAVQGTLEKKLQAVTSHTTGHSRARPNVLQQQVLCHYPKLSDLPSKILEAGYVSDIYVSHCNSPSSFFVQLTSDEDEIFSLLDKLNSAQLSDAQVELDLLQSGDLVVAEYPADGAWYRAVVQNKNDDKVQVQFIDFGNKATLLPLKIRQLGKQFLSTPMFSIQCTLEDGRKEKRDWTQEEIMTFKKAAGESGEKKIRCKFVRGDVSAWIVSLDLEEGPLFNAALKPGAQTESQMHCNEDTQPLAFKEPAVNQGQMVDAYASSIVGPNYFWCQFKNSEDLDKISLLAQEIGNSSQAKPIQPDQLCHRPCLALFSDQLWYRAQVINTHSKTVSVLFIDYGNESEIDLNLIKSLPTKLLESPPQAFLCQLEALGSVDGTWSDAAADKFFELLVDEPLKVTIQNTVMSSDLPDVPKYNVLVECNGIIVNDLMKDYWCDPKSKVCSEVTMDAKTKPTTGKDHFGVTSSETVQKDNVLNSGKLNGGASNDVNPELHSFDPQISQNKLVAAETQEQSITCSTLTAVVGNVMVPEISVQSLPQAADLPPRMIESGKVSEVYVSHINSLTSFFVQLVEDENTLFSLTELLNSHQPSENDEIHAASIQQGSLVKAMFPEDDSWYRAVVKDTTENGMIQVEFIDFGNEATVSLLKIRRLDEQLLSYPRYSIQCSCSLDDRFKAQKGMEQQIFLFKKIFGEAGENTLSCKFIKEDGITWEVKMTPCGITSDSSEKWDGLDFNASLVVSEPVKETFQLFMKPDVSLGQTVEAFASCVVGPDYFWCQFSNHETLDQITLVAQEYGNSSERQPIKLDDLDTGSPCLARFCDDQMWYRAQVIDKCTNTVSVLFVDFGNESETSEGSVKALPCDLLESPPQAFLCRLEGFDPSKGSWDSAATDNFYDLLVDKPLKLTVQCIDSTTDPNSPPYYVKVESPQYLVNELMTKFWSGSAQNDQNSSDVIESCEKFNASTSDQLVSEDKARSVSLAVSTEDMHTIESHGAKQHGANQIAPLEVKGDLHENKVDGQLDGADGIAAVTNSDVTTDDPTGIHSDLEMLLDTEESRKDVEDGGSEKEDNLMMTTRSTDWVAGLQNPVLPMVCTEDSCDSVKCIFK